MIKKILLTVLLLGAAYIGGSYYVGWRTETELVALMHQAQAQANHEMTWEQTQSHRGLFTSTGTMRVVFDQIRVDNQNPLQVQIEYSIDHYLHWASLARFNWSITLQQLLAKEPLPLLPKLPSFNGEGTLDWSGVATSSLVFAGLDNAQTNNGMLNMAPLAGFVTASKNFFQIKAEVAHLDFSQRASAERIKLKELTFDVRSDDIANEQVSAAFVFGHGVIMSEAGDTYESSDFGVFFDVTQKDGRLEIAARQTMSLLRAMGHQASNVLVSLGIDGVYRSDLLELLSLADDIDGQWFNLSDRQQLRAERIGSNMLARGLTFTAPVIKADIKPMDDDIAQTIGLEDLSVRVQSDDLMRGIGSLRVMLGTLKIPPWLQNIMPELTGFKFDLNNVLANHRTDLRLTQSIASIQYQGQSVRDLQFAVGLKGLTSEGLATLFSVIREANGDMSDLSSDQRARLVQVLEATASDGLAFEIPLLKATVNAGVDTPDSLWLEGLNLQVELEDVNTGAGKVNLALKQLAASGPNMTDIPRILNYQLTANNRVVDGKADYRLEKSIDALESSLIRLGRSALTVQLTGLSALDLRRLAELAPEFEQGLDQAQSAELARIVRRAIASGFVLAVPTLQLAIDSAQVTGRGDFILTGLGKAPLANFDLARLAQMQAEMTVQGQSPWLDPWVQQGLIMGLLGVDNNLVKGNYQFVDGQLRLNGLSVPVAKFVLVANLVVQQMVAQELLQNEGGSANQSGTAQRPRRGAGN
ncbi:DUF945 family protein [Orrella daihaiensis]|uniref:DUF945 family protein n=1 Tax=Orrella daihaiensis TaxID=2782176 RepID=A0ABY4AJN0_9BURK|nr:DUF945 family protein [Orrella daihaiensis]UOD49871.1 DUF945 family protein [Orrella daihaiensis]